MWWERAKCSGVDTELFLTTDYRIAQRIKDKYCNQCPVRLECLEEAIQIEHNSSILMDNVYNYIRGGMTPRERQELIRLLYPYAPVVNKDDLEPGTGERVTESV